MAWCGQAYLLIARTSVIEMNAAVALCIKLQDTNLRPTSLRRRGLTFWDVVHAELVDKTIALVDSNVLTGDPVVLACRGMHLFRSGKRDEGKPTIDGSSIET